MITAGDVYGWLDQPVPDPIAARMVAAVGAVNAQARRRCRDVYWDADGDGVDDMPAPELPADLRLGLIMQAARWFRRADTPDGIAGFADEGTAVRVTRFDPDIDAMLIDHLKPQLA